MLDLGHLLFGKDYCPVSGGGDIHIRSSNYHYQSCVVMVCGSEEEVEEMYTHTYSVDIEGEIQVPWDRLVKQLKADMLLSATCAWHTALEKC